MKKIILISASVLALGAASIAADADGVSMLNGGTQSAVMSFDVSVPAPDADRALRGDRVTRHQNKSSVRLVTTKGASVNSCGAANWPYYPAECLKRVETAGL
jgi:hypothetical protein